jgi:ribosomal protein S18 acetylase RimI-like enzyme
MSEEIRLIQKDELNKLLNLYGFLHEEDPDVSENNQLEELWNDIFNDNNSYYVVVDSEGELVSTCTMTIIKNLTRELRPYALIENVVTHPNFRERGLGTKVMKRAIEIAIDNNCYKVMLLTSSKNEETLRFYEKAGF